MLRNFVIRLVINAVALAITERLVAGIAVQGDDIGTLIIVALVFGVINAIVKPILLLLTCPFVVFTLGLFILVVNALMLLLTAAIVPDRFVVADFGQALIGGIVMAIAAMVVEFVLDALGFDEDEKPRKEKR
jgi:putative membrane protein